MPRRRLLIFVAAAVLLLAASYIYWAWDPVDVARYIPPNSLIVLEIENLADGLNNICYGEIAGRLPEPMRREALLPYRSLGPGINAMDIIGTRCAVFVPACAAGTMPRGAVMVARISQKAKLAETLASLVGKTHQERTKAGRNVRMVQAEGLDIPLFYERVDRILIISDSMDSLDAALGTLPPSPPAVRRDHPHVTLRIGKEGFTAILELLRSFPQVLFVRNLVDQVSRMMGLELNVSLTENPELAGHIAFFLGGFFERDYRKNYKAYKPRGFDAVPGRISAAISTNDPDIMKNIEIATAGVNRLFHVTSDFFDDLKSGYDTESFGVELTTAATRVGEETAGFLFVSSRKIFFPQDVANDLLDRLRAKVGETTYVGREKGGDVYRILSAKLDVPAYLWTSQNAIVLCSSENAFRAFAAKLSSGTGGGPAFEQGDLFLVADPHTDPDVFLRMLPIWDERYRFLLDSIGPTRFQATFNEGKIKFSGSTTIKYNEDS